jgi:hypothetical protein
MYQSLQFRVCGILVVWRINFLLTATYVGCAAVGIRTAKDGGQSGTRNEGTHVHYTDKYVVASRPAKAEPTVALFTLIFGETASHEPWLPLFARSAAHSGVDYFIVGDPAPPIKLPENVHHIHITYDDLVAQISNDLFGGRPLKMSQAGGYKVIDIKPLIGFLFRTHIRGYDWWGHVDNDMLMGDVRKFLPPSILNKFDVIPGIGPENGQSRTWGPFTMYRNVPEVTELFRSLPDLLFVYDSVEAMFIDEVSSNYGGFVLWSCCCKPFMIPVF